MLGNAGNGKAAATQVDAFTAPQDAVRHHLAICTECREEYEALQRALQELEE